MMSSSGMPLCANTSFNQDLGCCSWKLYHLWESRKIINYNEVCVPVQHEAILYYWPKDAWGELWISLVALE